MRRSLDEWRALLNRFDAQQDSETAFCARESISEDSVYRWRGMGLMTIQYCDRIAVSHTHYMPIKVSASAVQQIRDAEQKTVLTLTLDVAQNLVEDLTRSVEAVENLLAGPGDHTH